MAEFSEELVKHSGHASLVYGGEILQTHRHGQPLIEAEWAGDGSQMDVVWVYSALEK